jgi:hypothetical protein
LQKRNRTSALLEIRRAAQPFILPDTAVGSRIHAAARRDLESWYVAC